MSAAGNTRRMSLSLLLGLLCLPALFCWLILRRGYEPSSRRALFVYTGVFTGVSLIGRL